MRKIVFDEDEMRMIAMFKTNDQEKIIGDLQGAIAFIEEDEELLEAVNRTVEKLKKIPKEEFAKLDLESYREELDEEDEEE